jgi:hypothetical protein
MSILEISSKMFGNIDSGEHRRQDSSQTVSRVFLYNGIPFILISHSIQADYTTFWTTARDPRKQRHTVLLALVFVVHNYMR